jgi:general secretion pathway protein G
MAVNSTSGIVLTGITESETMGMRNTFMRNITQKGFTLIELLMSIMLIGILAGVALPVAEKSIQHSKEQKLMENLSMVRGAIDRYYMNSHKINPQNKEENKYPESLEQLVEMKYLRKIPVDPFTRETSWDVTYYVDLPVQKGIFDIHSRSKKLTSRGDLYSSW